MVSRFLRLISVAVLSLTLFAQEPLSRQEERQIQRLIQDLKGDDPVSRQEAREKLLKIGHKAIPYLRDAAKGKGAKEIREIIIRIEFKDVAERLKNRWPQLMDELITGNIPKILSVFQQMALDPKFRAELVPITSYLLRAGLTPWQMQLVIHTVTQNRIEGLGARMGELLVHEVPGVRMEALRYLEHLRASSELPRIRRCLDDPYIPMRIRAAEVLLCLDDKDSLKQIYKLLELKEAKIKVAGLLAQFGIRGAVSRITPMLKDQDQGARNSAIYALAELGAIEFNQEIRGLLEEEGSRIPAIWALAQLGDKESAPKIRRYLKDKDPKVRRITAQALVMLDDTDAIKDLQAQLSGEKDELARIEYIVALGRLGAPVPTSDLIKLLDHKMPHIQVAAANALASLNVKDGVEKIRGLLRKLPLYRLVLLKALGLLQDREVLQDLTELMQDRQAGIVLFYFNLFSSYELYRRISQLKPPKRVWCGGFKDIMNTLGAILRAKGITFKLDQGLSEALGNKYVRIYLPSQGTLEYLLEYIIRNFEGVTFMMDQGRIRLTSLGEARRLFKGYLQGVKDKR